MTQMPLLTVPVPIHCRDVGVPLRCRLCERGHVVRSGRGFRMSPYVYTMTREGLAAQAEQRAKEAAAGRAED